MIRVTYVIDHKKPGHDRWLRPSGVQSTVVAQSDPTQQAAEIAERFELWQAPIVESGHEIRVRVWPYDTDADLAAIDSDADEPAGHWTYGSRGE